MVFIKKTGGVLEADKPLSGQLQAVSLSEGTPYETLHSVISRALSPYFKAYVHADSTGSVGVSGGGGGVGVGVGSSGGHVVDKMAPVVEKKLEELELGLLHLQQNVEIPEVNIAPHPIVAQIVARCVAQNRKPKPTDFEDLLENASFLNNLQGIVNKWIREIQKVLRCSTFPHIH